MTRKIILPLVVLVVVAGAYLLATSGDREVVTPSTMSAFQPRTTATRPMQVIRSGDVPVTGGEQPRTRIYDPYTGRVKLEVAAESWQPVNEQLYHIVKPDIRIHAPGGQISYITADVSEMEVAQTGRKNIEPRRGWLRGRVQVIVDRTTRQWRERNPARAARDQHPEHLIHISLDEEARFDMEASRLSADGRVTVHSADADVMANAGKDALLLTWDQVDNRADYLRLQHGGRMELRRAGLVDFSMPGLSGERTDNTSDVTARSGSERMKVGLSGGGSADTPRFTQIAGEVPSGDEVAAALRQAATERPRTAPRKKRLPGEVAATQAQEETQRLGDTYAAMFTGHVRIRQTKADQPTGGLDCDKLELVFDFGREQRQSADSPLGVAASRPARAAASRPVEMTRMTLEWSGPLELRSVAADEHDATGGRFDVMATGERVHLRDAQGEATCTRMIYRKGPSAVWLTGGESNAARVWSGTQREISAREIMVDRTRGQGRLLGRGFVRDDSATSAGLGTTEPPRAERATEPLEIRWTDHAELALGSVDRRVTDLRSRMSRTKTSDYLRQAMFFGDVSIAQGKQSLEGEQVAVHFSPPRREGALADTITQLDASGQVRLRDAEQRITGKTLRVKMEQTADDRTVPRRAIADGDVRVEQPQRSFAAEHLVADFAALSEQAADGKTTAKIVMQRAVATRRVAVRDESQNLEADADQLDAAFDKAGRLARAVLIGPGETGWAYSHQGDYAVNGHHVTIDLTKQHVTVPGRGHAVFVTRSDFDGRALSEPTAVNVTFSNGMTLSGTDNVGLFNGEVHTSTDTHELKCNQRLVVRFINRGAPGAVVASDASFELTQRKSVEQSPLSVLAKWTRQRAGIESGEKADRGPRARMQPSFVVAEGDVAALTTEYDEKGLVRSRMRIAGPRLEVDLRREQMIVPGRGNLAMEDYRPPRMRSAASPSSSNAAPMLGAGGAGPSQTAFFWANGMSFDNREAIATFDRSVQMVHRSGSKLMLQGELAAAMKADVSGLRLGPGREATLSCDNLLVQFAIAAPSTSKPGQGNTAGFQSNWNELRRLVASGRVHLQDNTRTLMGDSLCLESPANVVTIRGTPQQDAVLMDESEESQHVRSWRGALIKWNRTTGDIEAPNPQVTVR